MRKPGGECSRAAFTLLEILLAIALLGLLSAALVAGANHLLDGRPRSAGEIFWSAVQEARRAALQGEAEVRLRFDEKEKFFLLEGEKAGKTFPLPAGREIAVSFLPARSTNSARLIGGVLFEGDSIPAVTFFPDGTCTAFRVQFRSPGSTETIAVDPWTCAAVLEADTKS